MTLKKLSFILHGILNVTMHIPALFFCMCFGLCIIGIIAELCLVFDWSFHEVSTLPGVIELLLIPLMIPPISSIVGIVRGAISFKKEKSARWCLLLSIIGLLLTVGWFYVMAWLGSVA